MTRADILEAKKVLADVWPGQVQADSVALLKALHDAMNRVADLAKLAS